MHLTQFIHQKPYEHIVYKVRRHYVTLVPAILILALLLLVPLGAAWLVTTVFPRLVEISIVPPLGVLLGSLYYLSILLFFYTYFIDFYLDVLVVTNDRLIDIEQIGLFARSVSELDLYKIQDITSTVKGFFATLFNFGDISIQTAGAVEKFHVQHIPNPEGLRQAILDLAEEDRKYHTAPNS